VGSDQKSGKQKTDNAGEADLLAQKTADSSRERYDRQILNKVQFAHAGLY
jgi:hypothetical protein